MLFPRKNIIKIILLSIFVIGLPLLSFAQSNTSPSGNSILEQIRNAIKEYNAHWTASETSVSGLSEAEKKNLCGLILEEKDLANTEEGAPTADLPATWDWRNKDSKNWITSVKDQGNCGSCWAFSAAASLESTIMISTNNTTPIDLSEQHFVSCSGGSCANGWTFGATLNYLVSNGIPDEACFPYQGQELTCSQTCPDWQDRLYKAFSWAHPSSGINGLKEAIMVAPIPVSMQVYEDFFYYDGGVYQHTWGSLQGGHMVLLLGWDDALNCWICKNSWNTGWGEDGFFRILWGDSAIAANSGLMTYAGCGNCDVLDGGYCTGNNLEMRDYYCDTINDECIYNVTETIDCLSLDGWYCDGNISEQRDYTGCNDDECVFQPVTLINCSNKTGWYCLDGVSQYRNYFCKSSSGQCDYWVSDEINCDDLDGWYCNTDTWIYELRDYHCGVVNQGCIYTVTETGGPCVLLNTPIDGKQLLIFASLIVTSVLFLFRKRILALKIK